jgi:hypothetical protein
MRDLPKTTNSLGVLLLALLAVTATDLRGAVA